MKKIQPFFVEFLEGTDPEYYHFDDSTKNAFRYMKTLWKILRPKGNILNMGIMKKTPESIEPLIQNDEVESILHVELDDYHDVTVSKKEEILWNTNFMSYTAFTKKRYDGVVIWHGPEHLHKQEGMECIKNCVNDVAERWVVVSCPWNRLHGWKHQPKGKDYLGHKSVWGENDFTDLGFRVISFGPRSKHPGFLIAWKVIQ